MDYAEMIATYENIACISDQMLEAARQNDWDKLSLLESTCSQHINHLKQASQKVPLNVEQREQKVRLIRAILDNDRQIRDMADPWMSHLSSMMQSTSAHHKLVRAYGG